MKPLMIRGRGVTFRYTLKTQAASNEYSLGASREIQPHQVQDKQDKIRTMGLLLKSVVM